jgi:hypothetical protein
VRTSWFSKLVSGFFLIDCDDIDPAFEAAMAIPSIKYGAKVEVRPCTRGMSG